MVKPEWTKVKRQLESFNNITVVMLDGEGRGDLIMVMIVRFSSYPPQMSSQIHTAILALTVQLIETFDKNIKMSYVLD